MAYKKPILTEIFCELFLRPGTFAESKYFDLVPLLKKLGLDDVEITPQTVSVANRGLSVRSRVRCWGNGRTRLVQLAPDALIVNQVGEYPGWDEFRSLVEESLKALSNAIGNPQILSISLNTMDKMLVPREGFTLGRYINCGGDKIPAWFAQAKEACDLQLGRGVLASDRFNRQLTLSVRRVDEAFQVDIHSVFHNSFESGSAIALLEKLHEESTASFKSIVTQTTENEVMGGPK